MPVQRRSVLLLCLFVLGAATAGAQMRGGVMADLSKDIAEVETKIVGLANAIPESAWEWRPGPGVRSVGEVFTHVAADNYFMPGGARHGDAEGGRHLGHRLQDGRRLRRPQAHARRDHRRGAAARSPS